MEQNLMTRPLDFLDKDDPYSMVRQDFSNVFFKHGLDGFTNPSDIGLFNLEKTYLDQFPSHLEDHTNLLEPENVASMRMASQRDDLHSYQDALLNSSYSPRGLSHHGAGHFNPAMNANFAFNSMKQPSFHQEHQRYPGYAQTYYYPNHYEAHMMQPSHDSGLDYYHHPQDLMDTHNDDPLSLMWSDESAKKMKSMSMNGVYGGELNAKAKMVGGYAAYEQEHDEEKYINYSHDNKMTQMIKMQEMSRIPVRKALEPQLKGINPLTIDPSSIEVKNPAAKGMAGGIKIGNRPSPKRAPTGKMDPFLDEDDDDGEDGYGDGKGRSTRGLRVLSLKVKEIVSQKKRTSYKEVAETLTYELRQKMTARSQKEESKDEQNVKRRVYDALNVLIAADVLRKEGKVVYCDDSHPSAGFGGRRKANDNKDKLLADIQEARKRNKAKIEMLHELVFKCLAIKNLIKTNKERVESEDASKAKARAGVNATRIDVVEENPALKAKNEDVIRFPFIVLLSSSAENSMNLNMDTSQRQLAIESKKPFNIFGDIDVLLKMGLHYVSKQMFDENIPLELQKYIPKYYLAALK